MEYVKDKLERQKGVFYLIYSDLSQIIGTQANKRVEKLVKEHQMNIHGIYRFDGMVKMSKIRSNFDALKQKSALVIYEIGF
jgi:hypothetical protein